MLLKLCFFKAFCDIVKGDSLTVFEVFHDYGIVGKSMNSSFTILVPKKDISKKVRGFQPISYLALLLVCIILFLRCGRVGQVQNFQVL